MNRKECEKALDKIEASYWTLDKSLSAMRGVSKGIVKLRKLIHEHFDNYPLKFRELEEGMWVWDDSLKAWFQVRCIDNNYRITIQLYLISNFVINIKFEENRFYRKQVK